MVSSKMVIGIFSRESPPSYDWLIKFLLTLPVVNDIRTIYISNNGFQNFKEELSKCSFAILYHSKLRGRVNVTDVTDAIYDQELKYLNQEYGKGNTLVVIDDLEDSSLDEKNKILQNQPTIGALAQDLFLFTKTEKASFLSSGRNQYQSPGPADSISEKLNKIKRIVEARKAANGDTFLSWRNPPNQDNFNDFQRHQNMTFWQRNHYWLFPTLVIAFVLLIVTIAVPVVMNNPGSVMINPELTTLHPGQSTVIKDTTSSKLATSSSGPPISSSGPPISSSGPHTSSSGHSTNVESSASSTGRIQEASTTEHTSLSTHSSTDTFKLSTSTKLRNI